MEIEVISRLTTLGHPQRMAVFRLLMRRYPDQVSAGELAVALDLRSSTLSAYLAALMQADLVTQTRIGTSLRYAVNLHEVRATFDFLLQDCCNGRPQVCTPIPVRAGPVRKNDRTWNILFVCTGNSARSILAETILRDTAGDRFTVFSAGCRPSSRVDAQALEVLRTRGHDTSVLKPKSLQSFMGPEAPAMDVIITVCDRAANQLSASWGNHPVCAHWGVADPLASGHTRAERRRVMLQAYATLKARIDAFTELPITSLDRLALQSALDAIAGIQPETTT